MAFKLIGRAIKGIERARLGCLAGVTDGRTQCAEANSPQSTLFPLGRCKETVEVEGEEEEGGKEGCGGSFFKRQRQSVDGE